MAIAIVERVISKSQCMDCPLGQNKVAERWPLVEVCRRRSRILKCGVNFCNNAIEPKPG